MDKASSTLRRSGIKLLSLSSGNPDLNLIISQLRKVKAASKTFAAEQSAAFDDMVKWSLKDENRAVQDAVCKVAELVGLWTEAQADFGESVKEMRRHFEMIVEGQKAVDTAKAALEAADAKVVKTRKEIKKANKAKAADTEIGDMERRLEECEKERDRCQLGFLDSAKEHEVVKMIRIKSGMVKLTQAYVDMTLKGQILFETGKFVARQIPDVADRDLQDIKYTGSAATMQAVLTAKEKISNYSPQDRGGGGDGIDAPAGSNAGLTPPTEPSQLTNGTPCGASAAFPSDLPPPYTANPPPTNPYFSDDSVSSPTGDGLYPPLNSSYHAAGSNYGWHRDDNEDDRRRHSAFVGGGGADNLHSTSSYRSVTELNRRQISMQQSGDVGSPRMAGLDLALN